ncbi:MAG: hypothetical protein CVT63_02780 [Candidatus Anoxymicrobium japonicum]|uniref:Type IV pilus assembly protein PilO n=1 Tax=Candidatus Anoxymicrobium japonicum TaxID=2013648 RepID=A0A2N3G748_9ACTN|nr:MAG: hypothetical protein CVT63_02780 [Candidatus Anoxymicrobium japonicum]
MSKSMKKPEVALLIGLFVAIVVGAACYFLLVGPKKGLVDKKQKEVEAEESKIQAEKSTFKSLTDIKNNSAEFEAKVAAMQAKIPEAPELPSLIRNIQAAADPYSGVGLPWLSFTPSDVSAGTGGGFSSYDFSMSVSGFYDQVVDLIYRLERMERAIIVKSVNISPTTSILDYTYSANLGLVQCQISAKTFTLGAPPGAAATPTPAPAPKTTPAE